ncbi:MAG: hypothetical protein KDB23_23745, partial [Planctomycetales bacterium]|nr:hypothetical protein [Planctomycetales bacterium]
GLLAMYSGATDACRVFRGNAPADCLAQPAGLGRRRDARHRANGPTDYIRITATAGFHPLHTV